jgi:hypothetical protein
MKSLFSRLSPIHVFLVLSVITLLGAFAISTFVYTQAQAASSTSPRLSVRFTCAQAVNHHAGRVCVQTQARAALTIKIRYCTNYYAVSKSLKGTQFADTRGNYIWTWIPDTKCSGAAVAYVTETYARHTLAVWKGFVVR